MKKTNQPLVPGLKGAYRDRLKGILNGSHRPDLEQYPKQYPNLTACEAEQFQRLSSVDLTKLPDEQLYRLLFLSVKAQGPVQYGNMTAEQAQALYENMLSGSPENLLYTLGQLRSGGLEP